MNGRLLREKAIRSHMNVIYECPNFQLTHDNYGIPEGDQYNLCLEQTENKGVLVGEEIICSGIPMLIPSLSSNYDYLPATTR